MECEKIQCLPWQEDNAFLSFRSCWFRIVNLLLAECFGHPNGVLGYTKNPIVKKSASRFPPVLWNARNGYWFSRSNVDHVAEKLRTSTVTPRIPTFLLSMSPQVDARLGTNSGGQNHMEGWTSFSPKICFREKFRVVKEFKDISKAMVLPPNPSKNKLNLHAECSPESNVFRISTCLKMMFGRWFIRIRARVVFF